MTTFTKSALVALRNQKLPSGQGIPITNHVEVNTAQDDNAYADTVHELNLGGFSQIEFTNPLVVGLRYDAYLTKQGRMCLIQIMVTNKTGTIQQNVDVFEFLGDYIPAVRNQEVFGTNVANQTVRSAITAVGKFRLGSSLANNESHVYQSTLYCTRD